MYVNRCPACGTYWSDPPGWEVIGISNHGGIRSYRCPDSGVDLACAGVEIATTE